MNVLIADVFPEKYVDAIRDLGLEVDYQPDLGSDEILGGIAGINVLVVRSTEVTEQAVSESDELSLVIRAGSGVNTIDLDACARKGIFVSNCPGLNSVAVAELAMAHILSLDRNIPDCVADLRAGEWNKAKYARLSQGLKGRTLGIIGFGNIGQEVAHRAKAFDMQVVTFDPVVSMATVELNGVTRCDTVEDLCRASDVITVHVPLAEGTKGLVGKTAFDAMKPGALVINTARGGVVDEDAFLAAAREKGVRGGFDVFADEPAAKKGSTVPRLSTCPSVYGTHHIGASTVQAQLAVAEEVLELLKIYAEGGALKNCVNLETESRARAVLAVRHYDRVGVLAEIFRILKEENINVEDMENIILQGQETACARIRIDKPLSDTGLIADDPAIKDDIIHVEMFGI